MHEFSIATALLDQVVRHIPPRSVLRRVTIEAGPLQGIDPEAMRWAWEAVTEQTACAGSKLEIVQKPWRLRCPDCGQDRDAPELDNACPCGGQRCHPVDSDALRLLTLTVDQEDDPHASSGDRERPEGE